MFQIIFILCLGVAEGIFAAFIIITLAEFGITNFIVGRITRGKWCSYCVGFWLCVLMTIGFFIIDSEPFRYVYLITPALGSVVARKAI